MISKMETFTKKALTKKFKGRKVTIGFDATEKKIVLNQGRDTFTFYAGNKGLEMITGGAIKLKITPDEVNLDYVSLIKDNVMILVLGENRALSVSYMGIDDIHVCYMPDEADLEYGTSDFMMQCNNRGFM